MIKEFSVFIKTDYFHSDFENIAGKYIKQSIYNFIQDNVNTFRKISYNMYLIENITEPLIESGLILSEVFTHGNYYSLKEMTIKLEEASNILSLTSDISVDKELNKLKEQQENSFEKTIKKMKS